MKIAIDARFYGITGIGRYLSNLIGELEKIDSPHSFEILLKNSNYKKYIPNSPQFSSKLVDVPWYSFKEQIMLPFVLYKGAYDLVHFPHLNVPLLYLKPYVITIHDLIMHDASKGATTRIAPYFFFKKTMYKLIVQWAAKRAKHIFVPTNQVKNEIITRLHIPNSKISVTYEAVDPMFFTHAENLKQHPAVINETLHKYGVRRPYIAYLSSFYEHKNHKVLIDAYARLIKESFTIEGMQPMLVLIGKQDTFAEKIQEYISSINMEQVIILPGRKVESGYVSDEDAVALLAGASLFVCPSKKEGFGINFLEAMALGVPVILSNVSCIPEVGGEAAEYFDPDSIDELVGKMEKVLLNEDLQKDLVHKGHERVNQFSWKRMAKETMEAYQRFLK